MPVEPESTLNISWMLVTTAMVMSMQGGFCFLEAGLVRSKNSASVAVKNITDFCLSATLFWAVGFGIMFGSSQGGFFGGSGYFFNEIKKPELLAFFAFQAVFCGTASTILSGAVAERTKLLGYLLMTMMVSVCIYPVVGHWAWNGLRDGEAHGWLAKLGFRDFAGGTVVHSIGGWIALAAAIVVGPRIGRFDEERLPMRGSNLPMATFGVLILWFGWFGFNGGSTLKLNDDIAIILINTNLAGAAAGMTTLILSYVIHKYPRVDHLLNGALAGLVSITASCVFVSPLDAVMIGMIGAIVYMLGSQLIDRLRIDDAVGAIPVHAFCGVWGTLAVAFFGDPARLGTGLSFKGQLAVQAGGAVVAFVWAFGLGYVLISVINHFYKIRVDREAEIMGLDASEHRERDEKFGVSLPKY